MKYIAILLSFLITAPIMAADNTVRQLALEYLTLTNMESVLNASIKEYDEQLFKNAPPCIHVARFAHWDAAKARSPSTSH